MALFGWLRRHKDVKTAVTMPLNRKAKLTIRVPEDTLRSVKEICVKNHISVNEATILLYNWLSTQIIEIEVVKRVRRKTLGALG
jgi:hypothetical protein